MRRIFIVLAALALVVSSAGLAKAAAWVDIYDPTDVKINWYSSYGFQHDIRDNGFDPFQDFVTNFSIELFLYDDRSGLDDWIGAETALIFLPLTPGIYDFHYASNTYGWTLDGWAELNLFGYLDVTVASLGGDFYFNKSILNAEGSAKAVPEPSTLLLLGLGLLGLVGYGRRMLKK